MAWLFRSKSMTKKRSVKRGSKTTTARKGTKAQILKDLPEAKGKPTNFITSRKTKEVNGEFIPTGEPIVTGFTIGNKTFFEAKGFTKKGLMEQQAKKTYKGKLYVGSTRN